MKLRTGARALVFALALLAPPGTPDAWAGRAENAEDLYRHALHVLDDDSHDARRQAARYLERATLLAPDSVSYQLALARLYLRMGFLGQARRRYERVGARHPDLAEAHLGQGITWRRDYLKYLDAGSLARSLAEFGEVTRLAPSYGEAWLQMVPLLVEQERYDDALRAAERLRAADSASVDGLLALGDAAYRVGQVERADSAFRAALPRLPRVVLDRYLDIAPVATEGDTAQLRRLPPAEREGFRQRFWKDNDPDLTTEVNEAQVEYWARVTQAYLLFFNPRRREWDQRGEVYVRYGAPRMANYNPVGENLVFRMGSYGEFPMNVLVWNYPELGMVVKMQDRLLSEYYLPPMSLFESTDPAPDPDSLAQHAGLLATGGGRGVFPLLPPGVRPLPVDAMVARFQGDRGPRLLGWLESPGAPGDSMWGEWVVLDSTGTEVARARRPLSASACDAARLRAADFASELEPGPYLAGLSVRAPQGGRGVFRTRIRVTAAEPALRLSDVIVTCGAPGAGVTGNPPTVRPLASPGARVMGSDPLTVYFEAYHLAPGPDGLSRLEFEYTVRSAERDPRHWLQRFLSPRPSIPDVSARRREEQVGDLRRQFVSVPVRSLPAGRYRLEIRVRDLNAGSEAVGSAEFTRAIAAAGG